MRILAIMAWMGVAAGQSLRGAYSDIGGTWYQALTSRFVAATSQVNVKCVYWDIDTDDKNNTVSVAIHSRLHSTGGDENINDYTYKQKYVGGKWILEGHEPLWVREHEDNYLLLAGLDNVTFYVLTPDINVFNLQDRGSVLDLLGTWDYATGYKEPVSTYESEC
jgi:hypothetical protein